MPNKDDILWFKQQFGDKIQVAIAGTPFTVDMLTAIACQETGYLWQHLRKKSLSTERILELCVGDTIDASANGGRRAFPKNKTELLTKPSGAQMFDLARTALVSLSEYVSDYASAAAKEAKFCRGFGIFQYDLQFFLEDPDYFLQKRYADFDACLGKCLTELKHALQKLPYGQKTALTDLEMAGVAIAYNTGTYKPAKGLKQGYFNGRQYYGEAFFDYLRLAHSVMITGNSTAVVLTPANGNTLVPPPSPIEATGPLYEVDVQTSPLRLRATPEIDAAHPTANIKASLPDGHIVQAVTNKKVNGFLEVETSLLGARFRGFVSAQYLKPAVDVNSVPVVTPEVTPPASGIVAVYMPRKGATITKRTQPANALSLNEAGQPTRKGTTPEALRAELSAIIDWLAVDKATHLRYQPQRGATFCNIYAHDYCYLAGVYLPRVWWTPGAIEQLAQGISLQPLYGNTIDEQRANDIFRWLRDFGLRFGWRQTGNLTSLQTEVNMGAIGLIIARRKEEGRSGHVVTVVPETDDTMARRNGTGEVIAPVQSQAGAVNFRYGTGTLNWWRGAQFAESAYWLHP